MLELTAAPPADPLAASSPAVPPIEFDEGGSSSSRTLKKGRGLVSCLQTFVVAATATAWAESTEVTLEPAETRAAVALERLFPVK